ncbi:transcriptional regulator [Streptomyces zagrosensis]|uniref:Transcriptional regulator n=1 Tax=Streptomyces zagrosensis TaxID=1042984 RepID=A0A7W9Q7T8_9ACTN|nr:transcriptional regulator [Streptomyces zagrosensis]MBB5934317.1 hypothetical protein [Streptomyces zagrosensis]
MDSVIAITDRLGELDGEHGGQHARPMASTYLAHTVAPYLKASATEPVRKAMLSAAAMSCYLTGWMAVDEGLNGLAQRYYVKGLELAGAADDRLTYCHILRGISVQAANLGHGATATRYANAAADAAPVSTPRMRAFMAGQQAHGYAMTDAKKNALRSLRETERALDQESSRPGTFGGFNYATLAYATAQVRYELGDVRGSVRSLHDHFKLRDTSDSRRSALTFGGLLAERQLEVGHLDAACATWSGVLDSYPAMHSGRVDDHVRTAVKLLSPYRTNSTARAIHERARAALAQRSA